MHLFLSMRRLLRKKASFAYDAKKMRVFMRGFHFILKIVFRFGLLRYARNDVVGVIQFCMIAILSLLLPSLTWADFPRPWQMYYQDPVTPVMEYLYHFHTMLLVIEGGIVLVVAALLIFVIV